MLRYPARFTPAEEGGYTVEFVDLKGCITEGDTFEEARVMAEDALDGYLTVLYHDGTDIPPPSHVKDDGIVFVDVRIEVALPLLVRQFRKEQGMSQGDMAEKLKTPCQTIQKLEKIGSNPTVRTLQKIGKVLGKRVVIDLV